MLVVERLENNDIYFHDSERPGFFAATMREIPELNGAYEITILALNTPDGPMQTIQRKAPSMLEAGRTVMGEFCLLEAFYDEECNDKAIDVDDWLSWMDGGDRRTTDFIITNQDQDEDNSLWN